MERCDGYAFFKQVMKEGISRGEFATRLWTAIQNQPPPEWKRLKPDDADGDGIADVDDALPFTKDTQSWP